MKKLLRLFSFFVAFFIGGIFYSLTVKASALPEIAETTFTVIEGGMQDAIQTASEYKGLSAYSDGLFATYEIVSSCLKQVSNSTWDSVALWSCDSNDCTVRALTQYEKNDLSEYEIIDRNGEPVDVEDIYMCIYDNGFFHGNCYLDKNGYMLYENTSSFETGSTITERYLCNIVYGGSLCDVGDWNNFLDLMVANVTSNNMVYNDSSNFVQGPKSYYCWFGFQNKNVPPYQEYIIYVANQYIPGVIVPTQTTNGGQITGWYTNDPSLIVERQVHGNTYAMKQVSQGNYTLGGNSYSYSVWVRNNGFSYVGSSGYNSFINYQGANGQIFVRSGNVLNANNFNNNGASFLPLNVPSTIPNPVDDDIVYPIETIKRLQYDDDPEPNRQFDPNQSTDPSNYPLNVPTVQPIEYPYPITRPIPEPKTRPDPIPVPPSDPSIDPSPDPLPDPIDPSLITDEIPLIDGLQNKFPFSIPWDIYNIIKGFEVQRQIPVLEYTIDFPIINYEWDISIDLTMYDNTATLCRTLLLILFIIGLALFSFKHFFGQ